MKREVFIRLSMLNAMVVAAILAMACVTTKEAEPEVRWDEGLTTGVTRITNDGTIKDSVSVSPDGTKLLYTEATHRDRNGRWAWNIIFLRDARNPAKTPLVTDFAFAPAWYNDNTRFLYVSWENGAGRIMRSTVSGGGRTYITRTPVGDSDNSPAIKDGIIICSVWMNQRWQLVGMRENGTEPTFVGEGRSPSWHPTQNKFLFVRDGNVCEMDIDAGYQVTQLYADPNFACFQPSYSPDGKKILFAKNTVTRANMYVSTRGSRNETIPEEVLRTHIFVMEADGTFVSPISSGRASVYSPSWGQNGEIFCLVEIGSGSEIYRLLLRE